jgi:cytochrome P450
MSEAISYEDAWARIDKFDPPALFDELRKERPLARMVYPDGHVGWIATSHELARQVLGDHKFSHNLEIGHFPVTKYGGPVPQFPAMPGMFIHMDPPDQTRFRKLLTREFTVRGVSRLAPVVEAVAAEQIAEMRAQGDTADFLETFAKPLVLKVLAPLIGLDYSERDRFADAPGVMNDPFGDAQASMAAFQQVTEFIHETLARKKATPGDDIVSRLIATGELSDEELGNITALLLFAGYETTEGALAMGTFALLYRTEQLAALRGDLSKIDDAVEEILRYVTVNQYEIFRTALEDVELGGESVRKGETVTVSLPAANRDPAKFGCPADLDLDRDTAGHVAFGYGVHQCVGQNLARLVLRIGLRSLLEAFPDLRLAVPVDEIPLRTKGSVFSVKSLPVSW